PEITPSPRGRACAALTGGPLFAVIPLVGIGGPLALLALLLPTVFGGALGQMRRWSAFLTIVSLTSTLWLVHTWVPDISWIGLRGLWLLTVMLMLFGLVWAWRRRWRLPATGRGELVLLVLLSLIGLAAAGISLRQLRLPLAPAHS